MYIVHATTNKKADHPYVYFFLLYVCTWYIVPMVLRTNEESYFDE